MFGYFEMVAKLLPQQLNVSLLPVYPCLYLLHHLSKCLSLFLSLSPVSVPHSCLCSIYLFSYITLSPCPLCIPPSSCSPAPSSTPPSPCLPAPHTCVHPSTDVQTSALSSIYPSIFYASSMHLLLHQSTSPSHSVSANLQALLRQHLQGQLVERPGGRRRLAREWERNWWLDYGEDQGERGSGGQQQQQQQQNQTRSTARTRSEERLGRKGRGGDRGQGPREHSPPSTENSPPSMEPSPPDCLSQLLLALQDELGQMSL